MLGAEHLGVWDQVALAQPSRRAVILACGFGGMPSAEAAAAWPVGERDAYLLEVHASLFGNRLDLLAYCPTCGETAAFDVGIDALLAQRGVTDWPLQLPLGDLVLTCRRPAHADLAAAWMASSLEAARHRLCRACIEARTATGDPVAFEALDETALAAAATALAEADPVADIRFSLACPACATTWQALFDPPQILWRAFDVWARTTLDDVCQLARLYGWSERAILDMHPSRRRYYLDAVT